MMKNVLIIANNGMGNSGVPNVICQVIDSQYKKCKISIVVFDDNDFYYPFLKDRNVEIIKIYSKTPQSPIKKLFWYFCSFPHCLEREISKIIRDKNIDIIHSFKEEEGWPALKAAQKNNVKNRITHCNNEFRKRKGLIPWMLAKRNRRKLLKYSTCNVGVCEKCCRTMFKNKPFTIIYNSYNESKFNNLVKCKLNDEMVLTHVATFSGRKNQLFSIDLMESLVKRGNSCKLNLVGFPIDEQYFDEMKSTIERKNLADYISIIDGRNGIGDIFEKTSFLLLPSVSEAAPIVLVEAQACGIRCFASNTITKEMDCGGVTFLPIDNGYRIWAETINAFFKENKNSRSAFVMDKFSSTTFSKSIDKIYNL